jgi:hypothetical protein
VLLQLQDLFSFWVAFSLAKSAAAGGTHSMVSMQEGGAQRNGVVVGGNGGWGTQT